MSNRISERDMTERFTEVVERIAQSGETLIVERNGEPVLTVGPPVRTGKVADLREFFRQNPPPDDEYIQTVKDVIASQRVGVPESKWD